MKTNFYLSLIALSVSAVGMAHASDTLTVRDFKHIGPRPLLAPVQLDTTNTQGQKLEEEKSLLDTYFNLQAVKQGTLWQGEELPNSGQDYALNLLGFTLSNRHYTEANLSLPKAPKHYELYRDGQKSQPGEMVLEPGDHEFVIKYLECNKRAANDTTQVQPDSLQVQLITDHPEWLQLSAEQQQGVYTVQTMMESKTCVGMSLSPDGRWVIVNTRQRGPQAASWYKVVERATGRVVSDGRYVSWMPRSNRYYYTRTEGNGRELVTVDPATGQQEVLAQHLPEGWYTIMPDEKHLLYSLSQDGPKEKNPDVFEVLTPDDRQPGWRDRSTQALYDLETGVMRPLTFGYSNFWVADVTQDCRYALLGQSKAVFSGQGELERPIRPTSNMSYFRLDLQSMALDTLIVQDGFVSGGQFSPDGSQILFQGSPEAFGRIGCILPKEKIPSMYDYQAFILSLPAQGPVTPATCTVRPMTKDFDPSVSSMEWSVADGMIYMLAENRDSVSLYRMEPQSGAIARVQLPEEEVKSFSLANSATMMAWYGQSAMNSDRLYFLDLSKLRVSKDGTIAPGKALALYEDMSASTLEGIQVAECLPWTFTNSNGDQVTCRYYLPVGFNGETYPMITYYYGGCSPTSRSFESSYPWQIWASLGYAVLVVQPSGAAGFGQEWASRHVNTAGVDPARDITEAVREFCRQHPWVNAKKVGCCGASYGGFMTQYLQTLPDCPFACAISHAGISDHTTYWGYGYWGYNYSEVSMANSYPWSETDLYVKHSPIYNVDKIHTPILFLHGTKDTNVPINNSIQMFTALKLLGRETALVCVEGEDHGVAEYNKRIAWLKTQLAWFQKYLQDDDSWWEALYPKKTL